MEGVAAKKKVQPGYSLAQEPDTPYNNAHVLTCIGHRHVVQNTYLDTGFESRPSICCNTIYLAEKSLYFQEPFASN